MKNLSTLQIYKNGTKRAKKKNAKRKIKTHRKAEKTCTAHEKKQTHALHIHHHTQEKKCHAAGRQQAKASSANNILLPTENRSAAADTMNAEPPDAQQEQGTTTENYARAEALRRAFYPCIVFRRRAILFLRRASLSVSAQPARIGQKKEHEYR